MLFFFWPLLKFYFLTIALKIKIIKNIETSKIRSEVFISMEAPEHSFKVFVYHQKNLYKQQNQEKKSEIVVVVSEENVWK